MSKENLYVYFEDGNFSIGIRSNNNFNGSIEADEKNHFQYYNENENLPFDFEVKRKGKKLLIFKKGEKIGEATKTKYFQI